MAIRIKRQIVRTGEKYESYRISLPKMLLQEHGLKDVDEFDISIIKGKIILTPVKE